MSNSGTVFDIQRASLHDGPGIRTTVFLKGCPLSCRWCHNPESRSITRQLFFYSDKCITCGRCVGACETGAHIIENASHTIDRDRCVVCGTCIEECYFGALKIVGATMTVEEVMKEVLADVDFYNNSGGGLTLSGGEPLLQISFSATLLRSCKQNKIHTCVETSGYISPQKFKDVLPWIDLLLFDYKMTGEANHQEYTGVPNKMILDNLDSAYSLGVPIILRCPIIPGVNDTEEHFSGIRALDLKYPNLAGIEILPYHAMGNSKRLSIGAEMTFCGLKTVSPEKSSQWIEQLIQMGCKKVRIG